MGLDSSRVEVAASLEIVSLEWFVGRWAEVGATYADEGNGNW